MDANQAASSSINKSTVDYDGYGDISGMRDQNTSNLLDPSAIGPTSASDRPKVKSSFLGSAGNAVKASFSRIRGQGQNNTT